jgi:hypothetical protein
VIAALALVAFGGFTAYRGYTRSAGPAAAVRDYYAALARADAPAALSFGDVPSGPRTLLTSSVLREQQRLAPLSHVTVTRTDRSGTTAEVAVRYALRFPHGAREVTDTIQLHEHDRTWRLDRVAVGTQLRISSAADRAALLGGAVPTNSVLLFPGALPIRLDTASLQLTPDHDALTFEADAATPVSIQLSDAGRRAIQASVLAALRRCLAGRGPANCPLPGYRYVPGSVRGTLAPNPRLSSTLERVRAGVVDVDGSLAVDASYRRLTYENRTVSSHGRIALLVSARLYAARPGAVVWSLP